MPYPKKPRKYSLFRNFLYAFSGLFAAFRREPNLIIQASIGVFSTLYFLLYNEFILSIATFIMAALVISLELVNTSFEYLCDFIEDKINPKVKFIKDVAAAAVLFASIGWLVILIYGACFVPPLDNLFK